MGRGGGNPPKTAHGVLLVPGGPILRGKNKSKCSSTFAKHRRGTSITFDLLPHPPLRLNSYNTLDYRSFGVKIIGVPRIFSNIVKSLTCREFPGRHDGVSILSLRVREGGLISIFRLSEFPEIFAKNCPPPPLSPSLFFPLLSFSSLPFPFPPFFFSRPSAWRSWGKNRGERRAAFGGGGCSGCALATPPGAEGRAALPPIFPPTFLLLFGIEAERRLEAPEGRKFWGGTPAGPSFLGRF